MKLRQNMGIEKIGMLAWSSTARLALRLEIFFALAANSEKMERHGQSPCLPSPKRFMRAGVTFYAGE